MDNILKAMRISGLIGLVCLVLSILTQTYAFVNYRKLTTDTNTAIDAIKQIELYTCQYQLTEYKSSFNKQDYVDYDASYQNCLDGISNMITILGGNKAMDQIDPDDSLRNELESSIDKLTSQESIVEIDDSLIASILSQASIITSYLENNRSGRQGFLEKLEIVSHIASLVILVTCIGSIIISQKYAKTEEKTYEEQIKKENYTDGLTGLLNQKYVTHVLPEIVEEAGTGYLYMFDMDNFKKLNDTCGHKAGDEALKGFAEVMLASVRDKDIPCRLGGDEFILYAAGLDNSKDAVRLAKRIQNGTKEKFEGTELSIVAISCGIAPVIQDRPFDKLKNDADKALYYVKENCKGSCRLIAKKAGGA